ncbi:aquaporin-7 isoform X2 [Conger conger]|uniref:aquaporin-7 isoform X2 n=1 Tax=Conger conger TaxID=82655 RepID=UPI002A5AD427|nr:aquaporin-7 isoform X2 [Conger conger]
MLPHGVGRNAQHLCHDDVRPGHGGTGGHRGGAVWGLPEHQPGLRTWSGYGSAHRRQGVRYAPLTGAHMNAAVSFTMCLFGRLAWRMFPVYVAAQMLGSFMAAGTVFSLYYDALVHYCGGNFTVSGPRATAGIFATYPAPYLSIPAGFLDQVVGTAMLLLCLMALSDQRNQPAQSGAEPIAVGLLVLLIGVSMGSNSGYAINPSRDLPPRIFTALAGWGPEVFRAGHSWWWVPLLAPLIGGVMGAAVYKLFIELHHPPLPRLYMAPPADTELEKTGTAEVCVTQA